MRSRLLSGAATPILGKASGGGLQVGDMRLYSSDPGAGFLRGDGRPYSPTLYPALAAATPRKLAWKVNAFASRSGANAAARSFAYASGTWVAVGNSAVYRVSTDGLTWSESQFQYGGDARTIAYGNGRFLTGTGAAYLYTSTDGISWSYTPPPNTNTTLYSLAFGAGLFVMGKQSGGFYTSPDGVTWTERAVPSLNTYYPAYITYANGLFVMVINSGGTNPVSSICSSPDGINWTQRAQPRNATHSQITYANGLWIVLESNNQAIYTSTNLSGWTAIGYPANASGLPTAIAWLDGLYYLSTTVGIFTSPDLSAWTFRSGDTSVSGGGSSASIVAEGRITVGIGIDHLSYSNYCTPNAAEGTLANGQPAIPYVKAA